MSTYFKELSSQLVDNSPITFLSEIKQSGIDKKEDFFLFQTPELEHQFYQSLDYLADEGIWTKEELEHMSFIAQTIDNDYILACDTQTLIIPYSFYKSDSETYDLSIGEFFKEFEENHITSNILPSN